MNKAKLLIALSTTLFWACSESTSEAGITEIENTMAQEDNSSSSKGLEEISSSSSQKEGDDTSSSGAQPTSSSEQSVSSSSEFSKAYAADTKNGYKLGSCLAGLGDEPILAKPAAKITTLAETTQEETPIAYMLDDGQGHYQLTLSNVSDYCEVTANLSSQLSGDTLEIEYIFDESSVISKCICNSDHWFDIESEYKDIKYFRFSGTTYKVEQAFSEEPSDTPADSSETSDAEDSSELTDSRDGKVYKTVQIGEKIWMAENLNYEFEDGAQSWCNKNEEENCEKYGRLYTLSAAKTACPEGWRLPSLEEWPEKGNGGYDAFIDYAAVGWGRGADKYGFAVLPAGEYLADSKDFFEPGSFAHFWTSTIDAANHNCPKSVEVANGSSGMVAVCVDNENDGYSVRCVKD